MILDLPIDEGYEFVKNALEREKEEKLFLRWVVGYQSTTTYEEFKHKLMQGTDNRSSEEILNGVESIMNAFKFGV